MILPRAFSTRHANGNGHLRAADPPIGRGGGRALRIDL
jgi:hypothetical protein